MATYTERLTLEIPLERVKEWLKIEHTLEDALLENLKLVAIVDTYNFMQNDFEHINENGELVEEPIPFIISQACLMYIAYLYEHRGDQETELPHNCRALLQPYKKLVGL